KTSELTYADIPLPFGEMHTENISSPDLIRAAIVAQLAKPAVTPSPFWQITGVFKYQVLTWIGIVGTTITLFANLRGVLDLADWARKLIRNWDHWTQIFWKFIFSLISIKVAKEFVPLISFIAFATILVVSLTLSVQFQQSSTKMQPETQKVRIFAMGALLYLVLVSVHIGILQISGLNLNAPDQGGIVPRHTLPSFILTSAAFPLAYLLYFKERPWVLINSVLFFVMGGCLLFVPLFTMRNFELPDLPALELLGLYVVSFQLFYMAV